MVHDSKMKRDDGSGFSLETNVRIMDQATLECFAGKSEDPISSDGNRLVHALCTLLCRARLDALFCH